MNKVVDGIELLRMIRDGKIINILMTMISCFQSRFAFCFKV